MHNVAKLNKRSKYIFTTKIISTQIFALLALFNVCVPYTVLCSREAIKTDEKQRHVNDNENENAICCRLGGDVRREAADKVSAAELRDGGRGRPSSAEPLRHHPSLLWPLAHPDSRSRREKPGAADQRLESIREYKLSSPLYCFRVTVPAMRLRKWDRAIDNGK